MLNYSQYTIQTLEGAKIPEGGEVPPLFKSPCFPDNIYEVKGSQIYIQNSQYSCMFIVVRFKEKDYLTTLGNLHYYDGSVHAYGPDLQIYRHTFVEDDVWIYSVDVNLLIKRQRDRHQLLQKKLAIQIAKTLS